MTTSNTESDCLITIDINIPLLHGGSSRLENEKITQYIGSLIVIKLNYRDFGTIDWFRELALDQKRHRKLKDRNNKTSTLMTNFWGKIFE